MSGKSEMLKNEDILIPGSKPEANLIVWDEETKEFFKKSEEEQERAYKFRYVNYDTLNQIVNI